MVKLLVENGADVNVEDNNKHTATYSFPFDSRSDYFKYIRTDSDVTGFTPLHYAVALGSEEVLFC